MANGAKVVIVGGGYAGVIATQRLARRGLGAQVTLVSASDELVNRIRLHEVAAGSAPVRRPLARLLRGTGAELRVGKVRSVDTQHRRLELEGGDAIDFDFLVLATGSVASTATPGAAEHAHTLAGNDAAIALRHAAARGGRLIVCGGGPTAVEAAAELAERFRPGLHVQLVTAGRLLAAQGAAARRYALAALARLGVEVVEDTAVAAVERDAILTRSGRLRFDACLWAGGFVASPLARDSGLPVDERGQLAVDGTLATPGLPWLYAAGDAARPRGHVGAATEMSCKCALPMGGTVARNLLALLAGKSPEPLRFGDSGVGVSLGRRDAVVHLRRRDGSDTGRIVTGRPGAWLKEAVCRLATGALAVERFWPGAYRWLPPPRQLPAADVDVAS